MRKVQAAMSRVDESRLRDAHTTGDHPGRDGNHDRAPELRSAIPPRRRVTCIFPSLLRAVFIPQTDTKIAYP